MKRPLQSECNCDQIAHTVPPRTPVGSASHLLTRRAFLKMAVVGAGSAAVAACSPSLPGPGPRVREKVQLVYQDSRVEWDPAQYEAFRTQDGKQYGLPKFHGALALYFNKDLFDSYRVDYPNQSWSHDDYSNAMKQFRSDRNGDGIIDLWGSMTYVTWDRIQMHVNGWGGNLVDPNDPRRCRMADPEALEALEWLAGTDAR